MSRFKTQIYNKHKDSIDEIRKQYYNNHIQFGYNGDYTGVWAGHIQDIYNNIDSYEFKQELKNICKNLVSINISSAYEFGEGEKKIMEHIIQNKKQGKYVIFSPDADTILLSLIIHNKLSKLNINTEFNILKYDTNEEEIENISINLLKDNICNYVLSKLNNKFNKNSQINNKYNIINDIICIFTFFGNDFLPNIESLNIKNAFFILIDIYIDTLNKCKYDTAFLLYEKNGINKINMYVFINYINKVADIEDKLIYDKYLINEYKNIHYLSNIINNDNSYLIDKLYKYCNKYNKIIRQIKLNKNKSVDDIYNIIKTITDDEFEKIFILLENNKEESFYEIIKKKITNIINNTFESNGGGLKLIKKSLNIIDKYHQNNIKDKMEHPKMIITDYDIEIYKLDKKINQLDLVSLDKRIGLTDIKYKDNEYKIITDNYIDNKKNNFYKNVLKLDTYDDKNKFINHYITGLFWNIDYYFNKLNRNININYISTWNYEYCYAPYFKELAIYVNSLKNNVIELNMIYNNISNIYNSEYYVSPLNFMNKLEQYLYITPKQLIHNIPEQYKEIIEDNNIFPDIDNINLYENKINIVNFKKNNFNEYMNKIYKLRNNITYYI